MTETNDQETSQTSPDIWYDCRIADEDVAWRIEFLDNSGNGLQSVIKVIHMRADDIVIVLDEQFRVEEPTHRESNQGGIPRHIVWIPEFTMVEILASSKTFQIDEDEQTITMSLNPRFTFRYRDSRNEIDYVAPKAFSKLVRSTARMISGGESSREQLVYRGEFEKALYAFKKTGGFVNSRSIQTC